MREVQAMLNEDIHLGRRGENLATCVTFDVSEWQGAGEGTVHLLHQRNGDMHPYPCAITVENGVATWIITASDVEFAGRGKAELQYLDGEVCIKSAVFTTKTLRALGRAGEEPPAPHEGWVHQVLEAAGNTEGWAEEADASARSARASATQARDAAQTAATDAANAAAGMAAQQAAEQAVGQVEGRLSGHVADAQNAAQRANQSAQAASQSVSVAHDHAGDALWAANQAQKAASQAKDDADRAEAAAEDSNARIFVAEYGKTTHSEVWLAYKAGKTVFCVDYADVMTPGAVCSLQLICDSYAHFTSVSQSGYGIVQKRVYFPDSWTTTTEGVEFTDYKTTVIDDEAPYMNDYPSTQAVIDYVAKKGFVSHNEQTLTGAQKAQARGNIDAASADSVKPYTDYWWYAPGKNAKVVEENYSYEEPDYFCTSEIFAGSSTPTFRLLYGDSFDYDPATGAYHVADAAHVFDFNKINDMFANTLRNKFVMWPGRENVMVYIGADSSFAMSLAVDSNNKPTYYLRFANVTRYTSEPADYISSPDETTYADTEGYALLGTVSDVAIDTHDEVRDMKEVRPDWNQNDEAAADFIKNKPFYLNPNATTVIMPETYLSEETAEWDGMELVFFFNLSKPVVVGKEYLVVINGTEYKATAFEETDDDFIDSYGQCICVRNQKFWLRYTADGVMGSEWNTALGSDEFVGEEDDIHGDVHCNPGTASIAEVGEETVEIDSRYFAAIKSSMPRLNLTATFADGTTQTYNLYGEAVAE